VDPVERRRRRRPLAMELECESPQSGSRFAARSWRMCVCVRHRFRGEQGDLYI
jgi:hypothetical protein